MHRYDVSSSNVESIGYNPIERILEVSYRGNRVYHYFDVDPGTFADLMAAPSKGSFINQNVAYNFSYSRGEAAPQPYDVTDFLDSAFEAFEVFAAEAPEVAILAPELLVQNQNAQPSQVAGQPLPNKSADTPSREKRADIGPWQTSVE